MAYRSSLAGTVPALRAAVQLDPWNAEYASGLGISLVLNDTSSEREAISWMRKATELNPHDGYLWMARAEAGRSVEPSETRRALIEHAVSLDPKNSALAWDAGNFFASEGRTLEALAQYRIVLASDRELRESAFRTALRLTDGNVETIVEHMLPPGNEYLFAFIDHNLNSGDVASAERVWSFRAPVPPFTFAQAAPYVRSLLTQGRAEAAYSIWKTIVASEPQLSGYLPLPDNLIINPGFEMELLRGGMDWDFLPNPAVSAGTETSVFRGGSKSLSVWYKQGNEDFVVRQFVPVKPRTSYIFSGQMRSEDLLSASGPRLIVEDPWRKSRYFTSPPVSGSTPWREYSGKFVTGDETTLVVVTLAREDRAKGITGRLWLDDLMMREDHP